METASLACCLWALVSEQVESLMKDESFRQPRRAHRLLQVIHELVGQVVAGDKQALSTDAKQVILAFSLALAKLSDF